MTYKKWRKWRIKTNRGVVEGLTDGPRKIMVVDFGDVVQLKDRENTLIVTKGCIPPIYFEE